MVRWSERRGVASGRRGLPWRAAGQILVALLALAGTGMLLNGLPGQPLRPPQPAPVAPVAAVPGPADHSPTGDPVTPDPATDPVTDRTPVDPATDPAVADTEPGLPAAAPIRVRIPRIKVDAEVVGLGIGGDGMVEVPPLEKAHLAGWYNRGPTPGEVGNSVLVGHVDSYATGPAVFFSLGALRQGDAIEVERADGSRPRFVVQTVASFPKQEFPSVQVYGAAPVPNLRLVTCGGRFDPVSREYPDNVVVFATLADT